MIDLTGDLRIIRLHCRCGGIGRRSGFKIRRLYGCASSSLATGTKFKGLVFIARPFLCLLFRRLLALANTGITVADRFLIAPALHRGKRR